MRIWELTRGKQDEVNLKVLEHIQELLNKSPEGTKERFDDLINALVAADVPSDDLTDAAMEVLVSGIHEEQRLINEIAAGTARNRCDISLQTTKEWNH